MLKLKTSRTGTPEEKDVPRATPQEETEKGGKTRTVTHSRFSLKWGKVSQKVVSKGEGSGEGVGDLVRGWSLFR